MGGEGGADDDDATAKGQAGKGEPGEGSAGLGKAWKALEPWLGRGSLPASLPAIPDSAGLGRSLEGEFPSFLGQLLLFLAFQHFPNVRSTKPTLHTVSPSCCTLSFLGKNYNIHPHPRFYLLEKLNVKKDGCLKTLL